MGSSIESMMSMYRFLLEIAKAKYEADVIDKYEFVKELDELETATKSLIKITCEPYYKRNEKYFQDIPNQCIRNCIEKHE